MINEPPPFKGLNIRIPIMIPIKGRGCINQGSWLACRERFAFKTLACLRSKVSSPGTSNKYEAEERPCSGTARIRLLDFFHGFKLYS